MEKLEKSVECHEDEISRLTDLNTRLKDKVMEFKEQNTTNIFAAKL